MKVILIGKVKMSLAFLKTIYLNKNFELVGVLTDIKKKENDDFVDLGSFCKKKRINFLKIKDINSKSTFNWIKIKKPDYIFCFGYSDIIKKPLITEFKNKIIGFHPTLLPNNRGKHPIIWSIILGLKFSGSTFFIMSKKIDYGKIIDQKKIKIFKSDDANKLYNKITKKACSQVPILFNKLSKKNISYKIKKIKKGNIWRKRTFADGIIDWRMSNIQIDYLIKGLTKPYCGAAFFKNKKIHKVFSSELVSDYRNKCENIEYGKIKKVSSNFIIVKCGSGLIKLKNIVPKISVKKGEYL